MNDKHQTHRKNYIANECKVIHDDWESNIFENGTHLLKKVKENYTPIMDLIDYLEKVHKIVP